MSIIKRALATSMIANIHWSTHAVATQPSEPISLRPSVIVSEQEREKCYLQSTGALIPATICVWAEALGIE
jgi:hypothetical protein